MGKNTKECCFLDTNAYYTQKHMIVMLTYTRPIQNQANQKYGTGGVNNLEVLLYTKKLLAVKGF